MPTSFEGQKPFQYQKISKEEQERRGILGRLVGRIADPTKPTRNNRLYGRRLWQNVLNDPIFNEKLENKVLWGEMEHPEDGRTSIDPKKIAVCLAEKPKFGPDGFLYGVFDILNTECGKILKTLLDYGSTFAISSRGDGDVFTNSQGIEEVDPDTYQCFCFDIVNTPGVKEARLQPVNESLENRKSLKESLMKLYEDADISDKQIIKETLDNLGISLDEDVDYSELATNAKELLKGRYGKITNNAGLKDALKKAVEENKTADIQVIAKLLCKYDPEFVKQHDKIQQLAVSKVVDTTSTDLSTDSDLGLGGASADVSVEDIESDQDDSSATDEDKKANENLENKLYNNINESKSWSKDELEKASKIMKAMGYMTYDEFLDAFNAGRIKFNELQQETADNNKSEEVLSNEDDGNSMTEVLNTLQETLKSKQDAETNALKLNEKLSVCYAKEAEYESNIAKLQEKLAQSDKYQTELIKLKTRTEKQSALIESANETIRNLNKKCNEFVEKYNSLAETYNNSKSQISSLNEDLSNRNSKVEKLIESNKSLREDLAKKDKELKENLNTYSEKLNNSNTLIEKYKKVATRAINKYIDSQALKLGITSNEIKNRLPENYTFNDIDSICESLQKQKVSMNLLPFKNPERNKLYEHMNVSISGKTHPEPILNNKPNVDDEIDDSLMSLARM